MPVSFRPTQLQIALQILVIAAATLGGAWIFQAFGYAPCELCLKQRIPYYNRHPARRDHMLRGVPKSRRRCFCRISSGLL